MIKKAIIVSALLALLASASSFATNDMALIPAGPFAMGNCMDPDEGIALELPVHVVSISAYYMDKREVTKQFWDDVYSWAVTNGYTFDNPGLGKAVSHPVQTVSWYDCVKWCNARSEKEGRMPCYYTSAVLTSVYRAGQLDLSNDWVNWRADGYRLPTEAEWEKAARGGTPGHRFPWSDADTISHDRANYFASNTFAYDVSATQAYHPSFAVGGYPYTSPVGYFTPNDYGLYDMAGNVWEWTWDWKDDAWYADAGATQNDTRGPTSGMYRVIRSGGWDGSPSYARCAYRNSVNLPGGTYYSIGFRCVRTMPNKSLPVAPASVSASDGTYTNKIVVTWIAASTATKYAVWRSTDGSTNGASNISGDIVTTNYDDTAVTPGQTYWYWIKAGNADGWSDFGAGDGGYASLPDCPADMATIPAGLFAMGNCMVPGEGGSSELPVHTVTVSAFFMDKTEVSYTLWSNVYAWAIGRGYAFDNAGAGKGTNHPVQMVSWYDCVKWCNARSEMEGLTPCYYTDAAQTQICRIGQISLSNDSVKWAADGYRLPTEAEWEKAARGGTPGHRFPWSDADTISHARANYKADTNSYSYDISATHGYHPTFNDAVPPYTSPSGYFSVNGYGLCDMAGNVWEWTWDWYDSAWYNNEGATQSDTHGPIGGASRVLRGGGWGNDAIFSRCAMRGSGGIPDSTANDLGFRCVRNFGFSLPQQQAPANVVATDGTYTNKIAIAWATASNATKYAVWRSTDGSTNSASNISGDIVSTNYDDTTATPGQTYWYWVKAGNASGWSEFSTGDSGYAGLGDTPTNMALIPAGPFDMGNCMDTNEGTASELPVHTVHVSVFYMDKYEVSHTLWSNVHAWAIGNGYAFDNAGSGKATNHPVQMVSWYDCVKWCNARSEMEGRVPCYYTDAAQTQIYRIGQISLINDAVYWNANGYRLPTEAEWEKAARGGASSHRYPWSDADTILHGRANYNADTNSYAYDVSTTLGYHPTFAVGGVPYTSPVGYFAPDGYGLCNMAGNVWEWTWDRYDGAWYANAGATQSDTRGPTSGTYRVRRGGSWVSLADVSRCAYRNDLYPDVTSYGLGFRCVCTPTSASSPLPVISPTYLDFGTNDTAKAFTVANAGGGSFSFATTVTGGTWLTVQPGSGVVSNQMALVVASANRTGMVDGIHTAFISVAPSVGAGVVVTCRMVVAGNSVIAIAGGPYYADQGTAVTLDGSASLGNNLQYRWEMGWVSPFSAGNVRTNVTCYIPGTNDVILYVRETGSMTTYGDQTILVIRNVAPVVDIGGPYTGTVNQTVALRATIADPGTGDTHEVRWDFGAGWSPWQAAGTVALTGAVFASSGGHAVQCEVRDNHGGVGADMATVFVDAPNLPPTARATLGSPGVVYSNYFGMHMTVLLDGSGSVDDRTAATNLYFDWREDVDNPSKPLLSDAARQQSNAVITFIPMPGTYKFHLVVNDGEYNSEPATVQANIPGMAGIVKSDGIGAVLPLCGVTLTATNQALGQVFSCVSDYEGKYVLDTGAGNGRMVVMERNGQVHQALANVDSDGMRNYVLTFAPNVGSFSALVNSGYYGGAYAPIPGAFAQVVIGSDVAFSGVGDLSGVVPFGGVPELWPRNNPSYNYQVLYQKPGWQSGVQALQIDPAMPEAQYPTLIASDACTVQGSVVGTNGMPVRGIEVSFGPAFAPVYSDNQGTFVANGMMRGIYFVRLSASDFETTYRTINVPPGDTNYVVPPLYVRGGRFSVYGEVFNGENGMPIYNAQVRVVSSTKRGTVGTLATTSSVASTRSGYYDLSVAKGARSIVIEASGYELKTVPVDARGHVQQPVQLVPIPEPIAAGAVIATVLCLLAWRSKNVGP